MAVDPDKKGCRTTACKKFFTRAMKDLCARAGIRYMSPHKGRYGYIHKWMETVETMEERQAVANNSLHTLAVLENVYSRMSGTKTKSVMRRLAIKQNSEISEKRRINKEIFMSNCSKWDYLEIDQNSCWINKRNSKLFIKNIFIYICDFTRKIEYQ